MDLIKVDGHWKQRKGKWFPVSSYHRKKVKYITAKEMKKFKERLDIPHLVEWKVEKNTLVGTARPATLLSIKSVIEKPKEGYSYNIFYKGIDYSIYDFYKLRPDFFEGIDIKGDVKVSHPMMEVFSRGRI